MSAREIPVVELATRSARELQRPICDALGELGFVALTGHGVQATQVDAAYRVSRAFFALPHEAKLRYHVEDGGARGYTPFGVEKAKDRTVGDLKEFWHVGREGAAGLPPNLWPSEVAGFRDALYGLYRALDALGARVLASVALGLGLQERFFDGVIDRGNSILRPLCYPPIAADPASAVRSAAHEDINLITLLVGSAEPGLQILTRDGDWIDAPAGEGLIICNVGDMLQRLTNHVLPSTTHRVINPPSGRRDVARYSIPFFLHPNDDFLIETLPGCIRDGHPNRYPEPITAGAYLQQRLREIGLM